MEKVRVSREDIVTAKEFVAQKQQEVKAAQERLYEAQLAHRRTLLTFLDASQESTLVGYAEEIITLADQEGIDPAPLFQELDYVALQVTFRPRHGISINKIPTPQTEEKYFEAAIESIRQDSYGSRYTLFQASDYLADASRLAEENNSDRKIIYQFVNSHLSTYFDIQKENWWARY